MAQIDDARERLQKWTAQLRDQVADLGHVRAAPPLEAEVELTGILRTLDEVNEAAGDCLAAAQEGSSATSVDSAA